MYRKYKNTVSESNLRYLQIYETIKRNVSCTERSIKAIIWDDLRLFAEYIKDKSFEDVTTFDVESFFTYCFTDRQNIAETVARKQSSLNTFYETMIRREYFKGKNPLDKIEKIKFDSKPRGYLTKDELKQLITYLQNKNDLRGIAFTLLTYSSACRVSEILSLNRDGLNYNTCQFQVLGKGNRYRTCMFSEEAGTAIQRYLATRKDDNPALFLSRENKRWSRGAAGDFVKNAGKEAGIQQEVFPHLYRHSRASHLLEDNVPLYEISRILGHKNVSTTQIYSVMSINQAQSKVMEIDKVNTFLD